MEASGMTEVELLGSNFGERLDRIVYDECPYYMPFFSEDSHRIFRWIEIVDACSQEQRNIFKEL